MTNETDVAPASARMLLRQATGDLHTELDAILSQADFDDRHAYATFLVRQAAPLFALETALDDGGIASVFADWPARRRSDAIRADLTTLQAAVPSPAATLRFADVDSILGALYVLEGSRLGAKFLVRSARGSKDAAVRSATAYLGHGDGERFWPTFLDALARCEAQGLDRARLVAGAREAFDLFIEFARHTPADASAAA